MDFSALRFSQSLVDHGVFFALFFPPSCFVSPLTAIGYFVVFKDFQGIIFFIQCGIYGTLPRIYVKNKTKCYIKHTQHYKIKMFAYQNVIFK